MSDDETLYRAVSVYTWTPRVLHTTEDCRHLEDSNSKPVDPEDFPDARVCRECSDADIERYTNLDYHQAALAADPEEVLGE